MSSLEINKWQRLWVMPKEGGVYVHVNGVDPFVNLSIDEAIQFSRMIVKAAAEAAGVKEGVR